VKLTWARAVGSHPALSGVLRTFRRVVRRTCRTAGSGPPPRAACGAGWRTPAALTAAARTRPRQSTTRCRSRPATFFPPSHPDVERGMFVAARSDCESTMAEVGSGGRPSFWRTPRPGATCPRAGGGAARRRGPARTWRTSGGRLIRDDDTALEHQLLDPAERQREAEVEPHTLGDDLDRVPMSLLRRRRTAHGRPLPA
jgi:hypothetical protein